MKTIASLENKLAVLRAELKTCQDPDRKAELDEQIDFMQDEVDELEWEIAEDESYQEATGTTPQDLYNERNSRAIAQSEMIDRFRNEI